MKRKLFLDRYLIWMMLVLGQLHGYKSCIEKERNALLELKKYIISISREWALNYVLITWTNDTKSDCCRWQDIECNHTSGRVIELSIRRLNLKESSLLNLSLLHPFEEVRSLDLYISRFSGLFDDVEGYNSLKKLIKLEILDLTRNEFNNSIFPFLNAATSLTTLFLRENHMNGTVPVKELKDLTNLELLDLSRNKFDGFIPVQELPTFQRLKALDLSGNEFSGSMELQGICKLKNIQELDLSNNKLVGQFPLCLTSLSGLRVLDLSSNQLTGTVPSALGNLVSLGYLSLLDNNLEGFFSFGSIANISDLRVFKLSSKSNSLQLESESSWKPKFQLGVIVLRSCNLEKVPHFLLHQTNLRQVDLSHNRISGTLPSWLVANNTKLKVLRLQNNRFESFQLPKSAHNLLLLDVSVNEFNHIFPEDIGWILPNLRHMNLTHNSFQGNLPFSLGNMKKIYFLDISNNSFGGNLPRNFLMGCYSLVILKMSHNKLSGEIFLESTNFTSMDVLFLDNNRFTGNIGQGLRSSRFLSLLDISNNTLTGVIPSWIGELASLNVLLLSNNSLVGEIPLSLFNMSKLMILDLSANSLSGNIPPHVSPLFGAELFLQDNELSGSIPQTLLANVQLLDLRNNLLSGNIPEFVNTQNISILLLRGNYLTGSIPRQLCGLSRIHLLDLSNNKLNGSIPSCFNETSFDMREKYTFYGLNYYYNPIDVFNGFSPQPDFSVSENDDIFFISLLMLDQFNMQYGVETKTRIEFAAKHRYDTYMGGSLRLLFGLDLSRNELSGEIPAELGGLLKLHALNLSHNNLLGVIPESLSGMKNMESLDLSFNKLQGPIPPQIIELISLAVFNVSYNNLSGVIPRGRQFNTFDTQSYLGNPFLCGKPTNTSCNNNNFQEPENGGEADESSIDMESFYWSFAAAYVTILLGIIASLSFDSPLSRAWFYIVDAFVLNVRNFWW